MLKQIFLRSDDIIESKKFYKDALDLPIQSEDDESAVFDLGDCKLRIESEFELETLNSFGLQRKPRHPDRHESAIHVLEVPDIYRVISRVSESNGVIVSEVREVDWNGKMALVRDPDGYLFELTET